MNEQQANSATTGFKFHEKVRLYVDDVCAQSKQDAWEPQFYEVLRTALEIESHEPDPQRSFESPIQRHPGISKKAFKTFLRNGRPPVGAVLVGSIQSDDVVLMPESKLALVHRYIDRGQEVYLRHKSDMAGIVVGKSCTYSLKAMSRLPAHETTDQILQDITAPFRRVSPVIRIDMMHDDQTFEYIEKSLGLAMSEEEAQWQKMHSHPENKIEALSPDESQRLSQQLKRKVFTDVASSDLADGSGLSDPSVVIYQGWIGVIIDSEDSIVVRLSNDSIVKVSYQYRDEVHEFGLGKVRNVGRLVYVTASALSHCELVNGEFLADEDYLGEVLRRVASRIHVYWISRRDDVPEELAVPSRKPPMLLPENAIVSGDAIVFRQRTDPAPQQLMHAYPDQKEFASDDTVVFVNGLARRKQRELLEEKQQLQGVDMEQMRAQLDFFFASTIFLPFSATRSCVVRWQDGSESMHVNECLEPIIDIGDGNDFQPGDIVLPLFRHASQSGPTWSPGKVGVLQTAHPADRIASVLWQKSDELLFVLDTLNEDLFLHGDAVTGLPASSAPQGQAWVEELPVYDIMRFPSSREILLDDFVQISWSKLAMIATLHRDRKATEFCDCSACRLHRRGQTTQNDWIGRVMDKRTDGLTVVRLGALSEIEDHALPPETLAFALSLAEHEEEQALNEKFEDEDSFIDEEDAIETWIEDQDGKRTEVTDATEAQDAGWDTVSESSEDDSDVSMRDADDEVTDEDKRAFEDNKVSYDEQGVSPASEAIKRDDALNTLRDLPSLFGPSAPSQYLLLESTPPTDHRYVHEDTGSYAGRRMKRMMNEHGILASSLPEGVFVRSWESRLDLLRILMVGPAGTPYEFCPFLFDIQLGTSFPFEPPNTHFYSWTHGSGRINPNLYEEGKICLSLLNTWFGEQKSEGWEPDKSTVLQVIVSLLGLVLVKKPYYNEAGYDTRSGLAETASLSQHYSEKAFYSCRGFIEHAINNNVGCFDEVITWLYISSQEGAPRLLQFVVRDLRQLLESEAAGKAHQIGGLDKVSKGALIIFQRRLKELEDLQQQLSL